MNRKSRTKSVADSMPAPTTTKFTFQIGDTVKLNSGSPTMTVIGVSADAISLCWYNDNTVGSYGNAVPCTTVLPAAALKLIALNPNRVN